ncbi:hypothetical protein Tco_1068763 [Tanacetum coccineum]|uniref:Tf2-1-like SH3-like domain-containing protein n=1 Tax=Tanacetum coccineum TaxID=301880 RepID=A0ABQ5HGM1_9ASTR
MFMTIQSNVKDKILATPSETSKVENAPAEMLRDLDQQMEKRADDAQSEAFKQENALTERLHSLDQQMERKEDESLYSIDHNSKERNSGDDQLRLRWMIYLVVLADAAESVRDTIGFDYQSLHLGVLPLKLYKVVLIKEKLKAQEIVKRLGGYRNRKPLEFEVGDRVLLKVSPWKGVVAFLDKKEYKLGNPIHKTNRDHLKESYPCSYRLRLPKELSSVHDTFHVSNLKKCLADANLHVSLNEIKIDKTLRFVEELVEIMDREIRNLKRSKIPLVKVHWNSKRSPDGSVKTI